MTRRLIRALERKCGHCLGVFLTTKCNTKKIFCSDDCKTAWHNGRRVGKNEKNR